MRQHFAAGIAALAVAPLVGAVQIDATIEIDGTTRSYILYLPDDLPPGPTPLIAAFHGGGGSASSFQAVTGLNDAADRHGFAVVYPDAGDGTWGTYRPETGDPADDLAFIDQLIPELVDAYHLDADRVYATGLSNGGEMSFLLGLTRPDTFAAIAPVAMNLTEDLLANVTPSDPIPVLNVVGFNDPLVLYDGGPIQTPAGPTEGELLSSDETMDYLAALNGNGDPTRLPIVNPVEDETFSVIDIYATGPSGAALERITVFGGGHTWPGGLQYLDESIIGLTSQDFDVNDQLWRFFQGQSIPEPGPAGLAAIGAAALLTRRRALGG